MLGLYLGDGCLIRQGQGVYLLTIACSDAWPGLIAAAKEAVEDQWYEYPRYMFSNESQDIMGLCCAVLDQLGVEWRFARRNLH